MTTSDTTDEGTGVRARMAGGYQPPIIAEPKGGAVPDGEDSPPLSAEDSPAEE